MEQRYQIAIKVLMAERDAAKKLINRVTPSERFIQQQVYKKLRNKVVSAIRSDRKKEVKESLARGTNPWHVTNKILGKEKHTDLPLVENGVLVEEDARKAEIMNEFFVQKIELLRKRIDLSKNETPLR